MTDDHELEGLDPYDLYDGEAARLDAYFSSLAPDDDTWSRPSRCEGWTTRDVLAHLVATEEYHHACLDGTVAELFRRGAGLGFTNLTAWNEHGVRSRDGMTTDELIESWRRDNADTRARLRARDGDDIDTSIGAYPLRWQAFHLAGELAIHADDIGVPIDPSEAAARLEWRARFSRFSLAESKPEVRTEPVERGTTVITGGAVFVLDDATFVEAVAGRLPSDAPIAESLRSALSTMP